MCVWTSKPKGINNDVIPRMEFKTYIIIWNCFCCLKLYDINKQTQDDFLFLLNSKRKSDFVHNAVVGVCVCVSTMCVCGSIYTQHK